MACALEPQPHNLAPLFQKINPKRHVNHEKFMLQEFLPPDHEGNSPQFIFRNERSGFVLLIYTSACGQVEIELLG